MKSDQTRDAMLVHEVMIGNSSWPLLGPTVDGTGRGIAVENLFHLGPIYYWFEIISAKIFGDYPDKLAYPDLLFSILSIPLFYLFFKKYFSENLSLALTGLYSISFFSIQYSRFAWNPNSIPFFILLFFLALYEFIIHKEKIKWSWAVLLGIALGVGIQLHIITFLIFPIITACVLVFSTKNNWNVWKKWALVLLVFMAVNTGQIISEIKTNFSNSKILLNYFSRSNLGDNQKSGFLFNFGKNIDCHIEANAHMLTSLGQEECSFYFINLLTNEKSGSFSKNMKDPIFRLALLSSFVFSFFGYWVLAYNCKKEKDKSKKYFLLLLALYMGMVFLFIMLSLKENLNFRYFNNGFFVPFMLVGFFVDYFFKKFTRFIWLLAMFLLFFSIGIFNVISISSATKELTETYKTGYNADFLVQIEPVAEYLIAHSNGKKDMYINGDFSIVHISFPLEYFLKRQNINLLRISKEEAIFSGASPFFYMSNKAPKDIDYEKIGKIYIFKLN